MITEPEQGGRRIDMEIEVDVSVADAWKAITDPEELTRWFPPEARVEPGPGGSVWLSWGDGIEGRAPIDAWEEGRLLRWVEEMPSGDGEGETVRLAVEFRVESREGSTAVRLVHSGFTADARWDDYFDGLLTGWSYFMRHLRLYLERHSGRPRQMIAHRRRPRLPAEEAWAGILGPRGLDVPEALGGELVEGDPFSLRLAGDRYRGRVWMAEPGRAFAGVVEELGDAPLFVEFEGRTEDAHCGIWLSTYGLPPERVEALRESLAAAGEAAWPAVEQV